MKKNIKNYEHYEIYEDGRVFNLKTKKFLKGSLGENGYLYYRLSKDNKKKMFYAHRLVAETFLDNKQNLPIVNHKDGNKLNNNISNLEWVNYSDNTRHWHDNNTIKRKPTEYYKEDLPNEKWILYGNYYVSSYGRIRHSIKNNLLKPSIACGYYKVRLSQEGKVQDCLIHKLVYSLFFNDYDLDGYVIDHIDGNKLNNSIDNLRKITLSENVKASLYIQKTNTSIKPVQQYSLDGMLINTYPSIAEAARTLNLDSSTISKVCRGINKTHGGFVFKYL